MKEKKTIAVFTSIRSEYGPLSPLLRLLKTHPNFNLKLLVGGAHLVNAYGMTVNEIINDGFDIAEYFPFLLENAAEDNYHTMLSKLQLQSGSYLKNNRPDLLLVLGDRFELIPVVTAAMLYNIPIAHISGGEFTEGAVDNQIRHAITKMAHIHFTANEVYKDNLVRMGEEEWRICVSGEPSLDLIMKTKFLSKANLFENLGLNSNRPVICCTFHPETINANINARFVEKCLTSIINNTKYQLLVTASNFDFGGDEINNTLARLSKTYDSIIYHQNLGQLRYYSLLKYADVMIGNSSSGLIEAKCFNLPVINVGDRQKNRIANPNVYQCESHVEDILKAIEIVTTDSFKNSYLHLPNLYGDGKACDKIVRFLERMKWEDILLKRKTYYS